MKTLKTYSNNCMQSIKTLEEFNKLKPDKYRRVISLLIFKHFALSKDDLDKINSLTNLKFLSFQYCKFQHRLDLSNLTKLKYLTISYNDLKYLPKLPKSGKLKTIRIEFCDNIESSKFTDSIATEQKLCFMSIWGTILGTKSRLVDCYINENKMTIYGNLSSLLPNFVIPKKITSLNLLSVAEGNILFDFPRGLEYLSFRISSITQLVGLKFPPSLKKVTIYYPSSILLKNIQKMKLPFGATLICENYMDYLKISNDITYFNIKYLIF